MELIQAIVEITTRFGTVSVATRQFVNLLDDLGAFKDQPVASKKIMKGLLESGFGELLYQLSVNKSSNWQNSVRKCVSDYISKSGYQDDLVNNLSAQLLRGLGIIHQLPAVEEPKKVESKPKIRVKDPKELLYALKQEYITALSELLTITTDEFGHRFGYYTTEANTKLYVLDGKIRIIAKELSIDNIDEWLIEERRNIETKNRPTPAQIKQAIDDQLGVLEREFDAMMEKGYEVNDDEFGLKSASFRQNAISDFRVVEEKIIKLGKRKNEDKVAWIEQKKAGFLATKSSPATMRRSVLDQLKNDYIARLSELDKTTKSPNIDFSDSFLCDIRRKLINLGTLLRVDMVTWCDTEIDTIDKAHKKRLKSKKRRNIIVSAVATLAILIGGGEAIYYLSSADERSQFEQTMSLANTEYSEGHYDKALTLYQKADNDYTASYLSSSYKGEAHEKAVEVSDKIITDWASQVENLLADKHAAEAALITMDLPANLIKDGNQGATYSFICQQINDAVKERTTEVVDELLNDIYTNHGKLSAAAQKKLDIMIKVVPDNYWLNFLKEKSK